MTSSGAPLRERVAFITVHFGDSEPTRRVVESVSRLEGFDQCRLVVVDNGGPGRPAGSSPLGDLEQRLGEQISVLRPATNLFYWRGAAFALDTLYPNPAERPEWVMICNNDIEILDAGFVRTLLACDGRQYHVVAPSILSDETGQDQNPFLHRPLGLFERIKWRIYYLGYGIARVLLLWYRFRRWLSKRRRALGFGSTGAQVSYPQQIYAAHGACIIFSREFFARGGMLDTRFALYGEELTVAEDARRRGLTVYYYPELRVRHREHATLGSALTREKYAFERESYWHIQGAHSDS